MSNNACVTKVTIRTSSYIKPPCHHPSSKFTSSSLLRMQEWHHSRTRVYQSSVSDDPDSTPSSDSVSVPVPYDEDDDVSIYDEGPYVKEGDASPSLVRKQNFGVLIPSTILEVDEDFEDEKSLGCRSRPAGGLHRKHRQMGFHELPRPTTPSITSASNEPTPLKKKRSTSRTSSHNRQLSPILRSTVENGEAAAAAATAAAGPSHQQKQRKKVKKRSTPDLPAPLVIHSSSRPKKQPRKESKRKESKQKGSKESLPHTPSRIKKQSQKDNPETFGFF